MKGCDLLKIIISKTPQEASEFVSEKIMNLTGSRTNPVLGLATGGTPKGVYRHLTKSYEQGDVDFAHVRTFNLDEYVGLSADHPQSYRYYMNHFLFNHVNIPQTNIDIPSGTANDLDAECKRYDKNIEAAGGIDLQLLGIGHNGHIGFNEPADTLQFKTHITTLDDATVQANARFFDTQEHVPTQAITMGVEPVMTAREVILMAFGSDKANILADVIFAKELSTSVPATILRLHPNVTVVMDEAAASTYRQRLKEEGIQ